MCDALDKCVAHDQKFNFRGNRSMAKRKTAFAKEQYYHIFNRGVNRENIFYQNVNYIYLLNKIKKYAHSNKIDIIAYCLMPNHYHFLLYQKSEKPISDFMQLLLNSNSKAINSKYHRSGTLFEGPFKSIHIEKEEYLIHLCRYIHRNPIDCFKPLVQNISNWAYSNYPDWISERNGTLVNREFVESYFAEPVDYKKFVLDYIPNKKILNNLKPYYLD